MGIITAALIAGGIVPDLQHMPDWVPIACYIAIGAGTMSGGWKIVKTMGTRITKVTPFEGVAAETAGAITLFVTEALKDPCKHYAYNYRLHHGCGRHQSVYRLSAGELPLILSGPGY